MKSGRRALLRAASALALATLATRAAFARALPRVGYLSLQSITERPSRERQAFLDGLAELGLIPGSSIEIVYRSAENEPEFLRPMCEELLREKVDVLITPGALSTLAALGATRTVPIVFLGLGDPVGIGAAESLARPGRNATGTTFISSDLAPKRIEFLKLAVPAARRVAFLWEQGNRNAQVEAEEAIAAARQLGIAADSMSVESQAVLNATLTQIAHRRYDALYVSFTAGVISDNRTTIAEFGLRHRLPVISGWHFMTEAGGLLSYAPDVLSMFRRSAYYVESILKGTPPANLPIERATTVELTINLVTARALGLPLPRTLVMRADRVIE